MDINLDPYRSAVDAAAIFTETDERGRITYVNPQFCEISGYSAKELVGVTHSIVNSGVHDRQFFATMWSTIKRGEVWKGVICNRAKNGSLYWVDSTIIPLFDDANRIVRYVSIRFDITERQLLLEHMKWHIDHDDLTGLLNRAAITYKLEELLKAARRDQLGLAVVIMDIDKFQAINELNGRAAGDLLLTKVAGRLRNAVRDGDQIGRIDSNKFLILLHEVESEETLSQRLNRVRSALSLRYEINDSCVEITVSTGFTVAPTDQGDAGTLLRNADQALYRTKNSGGNGIERFDVDSNANISRTLKTVARVRQALNSDELMLFYQPKIDLKTGAVLGFEALLRWQHPTEGVVPPGEFLPYVEQDDLICEIGEWCIRKALVQIEEWKKRGKNWTVSVNIGAKHFQRKDFSERLSFLLRDHADYKAFSLDLELVETVALSDFENVIRCLRECFALGVTASLDDFGTGYSSLSYLKRLQAKTIKIDREFIRDIVNDGDDRSLVKAIIQLSVSFGRVTVAEGVETIEQVIILRGFGCDVAQGYFFAKPMPAESVIAWSEDFSHAGHASLVPPCDA